MKKTIRIILLSIYISILILFVSVVIFFVAAVTPNEHLFLWLFGYLGTCSFAEFTDDDAPIYWVYLGIIWPIGIFILFHRYAFNEK